jgi:hypothetical protein
LTNEEQFSYTGPDWLLDLLGSVDDESKAHILLILWRAWHLRNDSIHAKGECTIAGSAGFLTSYALALDIAKTKLGPDVDLKGKRKVNEGAAVKKEPVFSNLGHKRTQAVSKAPPPGWVKINTDGAFCPRTGEASVGVIARDHQGVTILSAWRFIRHCGSPEEAEAEACLEGIRLAAEWVRGSDLYGNRLF